MSSVHDAHNEHDAHGHHGSPFIQHHFDDAKHQFDTGKLGIWFFLVQEVLFFSALFVAYIVYRSHHPEIFAYAHHYLDVKMGAINTAVLIISSLSAAWAVRCAQLNQKKGLILCLSITIVCAFGFLGIKYKEYMHKIREGVLFGQYFDPCVSSGGGPLVNKDNDCGGHKSSVDYDKASGKATAGCLSAKIDKDPNEPGYQADCTVSEVKRTLTAGKWVDGASRPIPLCEEEAPAKPGKEEKSSSGEEKKPKNAPCYQLVDNPNVCPAGPAALVIYPDEEKRGPEIAIKAECKDAPAAVVPADPDATTTVAPVMGAKSVQQVVPPTKHQLQEKMALGAPPPNTNMFFSIYFAMTGLHGIHVIVGILIFIWLLRRAIRGDFTSEYFGPIDYAALYWHLVDLIWIFLFPLLYLIH